MSIPSSAPVQKGRREGKSFSVPAEKVVDCRHCHQWEPAVADDYCGFCGHPLLALEVHPESLILISTLAPKKEFSFRNAGPQALQAVIVPRGQKFQALVFEPEGTFDLAPDQEITVRVELDADQLPTDFRDQVLDYVCLINNDPRKQFPLPITVRSGPRPKVLSSLLEFGEIQEGKAVERSLVIANLGGIPLNVREVSSEGSSHLRLKEPFASALVQPGQKLEIAILWDSKGEEKEADTDATGVRISFVNYPESIFVPARARTFRFLLELKPNLIRLAQVLAKQDYATQVRVENQGTTDLEIVGIESDQPWLEIVSRAKGFTLLCPESAGERSGDLAPTTFSRSYDFKVVCHPQEIAAGKQLGRVTVRILGQESKVLGVEINVVHPKPYPDYIGIDFGTSNSVVAVFNTSTYDIDLVKDESSHSALIPSVLVFEDAVTYNIGQSAKNEIGTASDRSTRSIKRIMGYDHEREFFGHRFTPEQLASLIIRRLVQWAERKIQNDLDGYFDVRKAIITVPANFFDLQIRGILSACQMAGLDTEEVKVRQAADAIRESLGQAVNAGVILDEPSAAVLYYIYHLSQNPGSSDLMQAINREGGLLLLVFDYGGGTLDVSVANVVRLESREAGLKILANMGDNGIGGDSIDLVLMREILGRCKSELHGFDFDTSLINENFKVLEARRDKDAWSVSVWKELLRIRNAWKDLAEAAKVRLSDFDQVEIDILPDLIVKIVEGKIQASHRSVKVSVFRSLFEDLLQPILDRCTQLIDSALNLAGISHDRVDYILHTGRQSLLPIIRQRVLERFPTLPPNHDLLEPEHLKVCVAKGAALYGWMRDKLVRPEARIHLLSEGRRLPHSYGVEKFTNFLQPEFDEVIPRGSAHPTAASKNYGPEMVPPGGMLNLKFYQNTGTSKMIVRNPQVSLIGQIAVDTMADGEPGCDVRFVIDANRKLEVFADGQEVPIQPSRLHGEESWMG